MLLIDGSFFWHTHSSRKKRLNMRGRHCIRPHICTHVSHTRRERERTTAPATAMEFSAQWLCPIITMLVQSRSLSALYTHTEHFSHTEEGLRTWFITHHWSSRSMTTIFINFLSTAKSWASRIFRWNTFGSISSLIYPFYRFSTTSSWGSMASCNRCFTWKGGCIYALKKILGVQYQCLLWNKITHSMVRWGIYLYVRYHCFLWSTITRPNLLASLLRSKKMYCATNIIHTFYHTVWRASVSWIILLRSK